jgi:hypothetical protein
MDSGDDRSSTAGMGPDWTLIPGPASTLIDSGVAGGVAGGIAAAYSPALSSAAARAAILAAGPAAGFFTSEAIAGGTAVSAGALINLVNGDPLSNDLGYALLIGAGSPFLSGEGLLIGSGYLGESSVGAANALALNSAVFGAIGILADQTIHAQGGGLAGQPGPYGGGILINKNGGSACQVSNPNVP